MRKPSPSPDPKDKNKEVCLICTAEKKILTIILLNEAEYVVKNYVDHSECYNSLRDLHNSSHHMMHVSLIHELYIC